MQTNSNWTTRVFCLFVFNIQRVAHNIKSVTHNTERNIHHIKRVAHDIKRVTHNINWVTHAIKRACEKPVVWIDVHDAGGVRVGACMET